MIKVANYVGGKLVEPQGGKYLDNFAPAKGVPYSLVPDSDSTDVDAAVKAALSAGPNWSALSNKERSEHLFQVAGLIDKNFERLAEAESTDTGKPIQISRTVDIPRSKSNLEFFANEILNFGDFEFDQKQAGQNTVKRYPLGVVGAISPWNLPLYLFTWKIAPALAAGNTVVAKPSELTPMTAYIFSELCIEAGLPAGVLNIVQGLGPKVGERITTHPDVKAVSFTGSTATGKMIAQNCAKDLKKYTLEMGGKNPNIIFADCDFEKAVETTIRSSFANQGQICLCGSRIFVEKPIYEKFKNAVVEKTRALKQGDPLNEATQQGAVVSEAHFKKILSYIEIAKKEGGTILCGGEPAAIGGEFSKGYFLQPTLIEGLGPEAQTNQDEIFGPVATLIPFENEDEVIQGANCTRYGLSASIWTQDKEKAYRVADRLDSGVVWINTWLMRDLRTPFGGMKDSGRGREGGRFALEFFTEPKNICFNG